ncbi:AraC family transcriptional regulator [Rubellimicrobium rubrum]|uniref:AraC family transcriptional regulator n=2 Tax=Rubellimicrobium rubrum TaxID=2585369 RepID=A0A5C4MNX7_9RHOB|nr:AraC family transcriptional regulator [Rubellimicrobium rubrum]
MHLDLCDALHRLAEAHADPAGIARLPIPGLTAVRATAASEIQYEIFHPLVALVVQGSKRVTLGDQDIVMHAGDSLVIGADVPTRSRITGASVAQPYLALVIDLDLATLTELTMEMRTTVSGPAAPLHRSLWSEPTEAEVSDAALRLLRLLDRPDSQPVLQGQLLRELHYWLLVGRHGAAIQRLGRPDAHVSRIARAVAVLRAEYTQPLRVGRLAAVSGMSLSSFHGHFRAVTSLSPLQFQKHLRLVEARRLMRTENLSASRAAYEVGYESVPQFTREYGRLFGLPPAKDARASRAQDRAQFPEGDELRLETEPHEFAARDEPAAHPA